MSHTLYFEDAESIGAYVDLVQCGVAGIAIADLEDVDTRVWGALKVRFKPVRAAAARFPTINHTRSIHNGSSILGFCRAQGVILYLEIYAHFSKLPAYSRNEKK